MKIFEESGMGMCSLFYVFMDFNVTLFKFFVEKKIDEIEYKRNIGCL